MANETNIKYDFSYIYRANKLGQAIKVQQHTSKEFQANRKQQQTITANSNIAT